MTTVVEPDCVLGGGGSEELAFSVVSLLRSRGLVRL